MPISVMDRLARRIVGIQVDTTIADNDQMRAPGHERHYFAVGRSAAHVITTALLARKSFPGGDAPVETVLDYGCGHGRVARFLRVMFPAATITGTDYVDDGVRWCASMFGYVSHSGPVPQSSFDLIWLGSVFTHLPEAMVRAIVAELKAALRPNGLLIFTTQGRHSARRIERALDTGESPGPWLSYNLSDELAAELVRSYADGRYAYVDYPGQTGYGVTIVPLSWYTNPALIGDDFTLLSVQEKAWDTHQDVVVLMRAGVGSLEKGMFY